jgi:hypothetical protein
MIIGFFVATFGLSSTPLMGNEPTGRDPRVVVDSHRLPAPTEVDTFLRGRSTLGKPYSVHFSSTAVSTKVAISASLEGSKLGKVTLNLERYRDIDLAPFVGVGSDGIELIFRFGEFRTDCYLNDDGRDRVTVWFSKQEAPEVNVTSFANCRNE